MNFGFTHKHKYLSDTPAVCRCNAIQLHSIPPIMHCFESPSALHDPQFVTQVQAETFSSCQWSHFLRFDIAPFNFSFNTRFLPVPPPSLCLPHGVSEFILLIFVLIPTHVHADEASGCITRGPAECRDQSVHRTVTSEHTVCTWACIHNRNDAGLACT